MTLRSVIALFLAAPLLALERPRVEFKIFQFPPDRIPTIDGKINDWDVVPESYVIATDQLKETVKGLGVKYDKNDLDVRVRVGWVRGLNRLYFLYEASDDYWKFEPAGRLNDLFEVVVDGDLSGGPLISTMHPNAALDEHEAFFCFHGVHAQNYHIFTPAPNRDWAMVWGSQGWIKELPYSNAAYTYNFKSGESGRVLQNYSSLRHVRFEAIFMMKTSKHRRLSHSVTIRQFMSMLPCRKRRWIHSGNPGPNAVCGLARL